MALDDTITIESSDCMIWYRDQVIIEIMASIMRDIDITIFLKTEGPCAKSLGLYDLLDDMCKNTGYNPARFLIRTCNLKEHSTKYRIQIEAPFKDISLLKNKKHLQPTKTITSKTQHFGQFIGHGNRIRLFLASYLHKYHPKKTFQTYHTKIKFDYCKEFLALEDLLSWNYGWENFEMAAEFLKIAPLTYDHITHYPIYTGVDDKSLDEMYGAIFAYPKFFVDIVCQTYFTGDTLFLDEKMWRPILSRTPFIAQGPRNFIKNLRIMGFKTFDRWWDEGYSEDPHDYQTKGIIENIDRLAKLSTDELAIMYEEMRPTLDHNFEVFMSLKPETFLKQYI